MSMVWTADVDGGPRDARTDVPRSMLPDHSTVCDGAVVVDCVVELLAGSAEPGLVLNASGDVQWANEAFWRLPHIDPSLGPAALCEALQCDGRGALIAAIETLRDDGRRSVTLAFDDDGAAEIRLSLTSLARAGSDLVAARVIEGICAPGLADRVWELEAVLLQIRSELRALHDPRSEQTEGIEAGSVPLPADLAARQRDVATLILQGRSVDDIAATLGLSPHTVRNHLKVVFRRTGVHSRAAFVARYHL
jgi:DNA-binding CsgD family transcriptional regulator